MGFIFFHQNFLELKDGFSEAETVLCSCEAALCKVTQSIWLGTFWIFGHFFGSPFAFQSLLPNPNLPHSTLNNFTIDCGEEGEEGGCTGTMRNAVPGNRAGRREDQRQ